MDLQSPTTILAAWALAPILMLVTAAGLGLLASAVAGVELGPLCVPTGYLVGIVLMVGLLKLGAGATVAVAVTAVAAAAGGAPAGLRWARRRGWRRIDRGGLLAPAAAGVGAYGLALAPLAGSGRLGVLGYVLNNDGAVHSAVIEMIRDNGAESPTGGFASSYTHVGSLLDTGYPLGSHVWPLLGSVSTGLDAFYIWTPAIAFAAAMLALVAFAALRRLDAPRWPAAAAAALLPCGYLLFSFIAQGSGKEVVTAVAVYGTITLGAVVVRGDLRWRSLPLLLVAPAAALLTFGAGAGSWLAVPGIALLIALGWRARHFRPRPSVVAATVAVLALATAIAIPLIREALDYVQSAETTFRNPAQYGNLLGAVAWEQVFNLWFSYDYRVQPPTFETLSAIGPWVGGVFAALGVCYSVYRRDPLIPLVVLSGVTAAIVISERYSIYLDTKSYAILGPALGLAAAAGVMGLLAGPRVLRVLGSLAGVVLAAGVLAGASFVYAGAWVSPEDRFEELGAIAERFEGQGPMLINEREEWSYNLLRDSEPVESWGGWQPLRGFRIGEEFPPFLPHTPDFDDYSLEHVARFNLLLERRRPGGSRPPANYRVAYESPRYRVWERVGPMPARHLALGLFTLDNARRLDCRRPGTQSLFRAARREGKPLLASVPGRRTLEILPIVLWRKHELRPETPPTGMINRRGGAATGAPVIPRGTYDAWIQGAFGPGVGLFVDGRPKGAVFGDLGLPSAWHSLGTVEVPRRARMQVAAVSLAKVWWQSGSQRSDLTGQVVFDPRTPTEPIRVAPSKLGTLCGKRLDWLELPA